MERKPNPAPPLAEYADVSDAVLWYAGGDPTLRPLTGVVIERSPGGGPGQACLNIVTFTGGGLAVQEGVVHMDNPRAHREGNSGGGWRHVPSRLAFNQFMLAAGLIKWDGDESYVANPDFDAMLLGKAIDQVMQHFVEQPPMSRADRKEEVERQQSRQAGGRQQGGQSPPPPPVPPVPPPPPAT